MFQLGDVNCQKMGSFRGGRFFICKAVYRILCGDVREFPSLPTDTQCDKSIFGQSGSPGGEPGPPGNCTPVPDIICGTNSY